MAHCQESSCRNYRIAICLHCMLPLCLNHIETHQLKFKKEVMNLHDQMHQLVCAIENTSRMIIEERQTEVKRWVKWRQEKISEIEEEYTAKIQFVKIHEQVLLQSVADLQKRLITEVRQPLQRIPTNASSDPRVLNDITSAITSIRARINVLGWNLDKAVIDSFARYPTVSKPTPKTISTVDSGTSMSDSGLEPETTTPIQADTSKTSTKKKKIKESWKPCNLFFTLFRDVGPQSVQQLHAFVKVNMTGENGMENKGVITLVFSFLETWHKTKEKGKHKQLILDRHVSTIAHYVSGKESETKVLIAMEYFFYKLQQKGSTEITMMTMLLELFLARRCISVDICAEWYLHDTFASTLLGMKTNKSWAEPFLVKHGFRTEAATTEADLKGTTRDTEGFTILGPSPSPSVSSSNVDSISTSSSLSQKKTIRLRKPFKNLVKLFRNLSPENDAAIHQYIKQQSGNNIDVRLIMLVRSYLQAWSSVPDQDQKALLLKQISIIKVYQDEPDFQMKILFSIEVFFGESKAKSIRSAEVMSMLLAFFLEQGCIDKETILLWYEKGHGYNDTYREEARKLAQSFIERLNL